VSEISITSAPPSRPVVTVSTPPPGIASTALRATFTIPARLQLRRQHGQALVDQRLQIGGRLPGAGQPAQPQIRLDQAGHAADLAREHVQVAGRLALLAHRARQQLGVHGHTPSGLRISWASREAMAPMAASRSECRTRARSASCSVTSLTSSSSSGAPSGVRSGEQVSSSVRPPAPAAWCCRGPRSGAAHRSVWVYERMLLLQPCPDPKEFRPSFSGWCSKRATHLGYKLCSNAIERLSRDGLTLPSRADLLQNCPNRSEGGGFSFSTGQLRAETNDGPEIVDVPKLDEIAEPTGLVWRHRA
jgi:hypothetical protein